MKKQRVTIAIVAILVTVGLSGCLNNDVEFKLKNNCNSEIHVNLVLSGAAITYTCSHDGKSLGNFSKTIDVYIYGSRKIYKY